MFGAPKNTRTQGEGEEEPIPNELAQVDLPEEQRQFYQHEFAQGSSFVLIHPRNHLLEIRDILNRYGAYHVFVPFQAGGEQAIPIRQEVLQIQKQIVDVGEIRIHKRVITEERTFTVPVTREEVTIEHLPLTSASQAYNQQQAASGTTASEYMRNATPAPSSLEGEVLKEEGAIRILVHKEVVVIQKEVVVIEEIIVQKQIIQDIEHLVEPIKHEEVHIERVGKVHVYETNMQEGSGVNP